MYWHDICALSSYLLFFECSSVKQKVSVENARWLVSFARVHDLHCEGLNCFSNIELWSWKKYLSLIKCVSVTSVCVNSPKELSKTQLPRFPHKAADWGEAWERAFWHVSRWRWCCWFGNYKNHCCSLRLSFDQGENWGHKQGHACTCMNQILSLRCLKPCCGFLLYLE